MTSSVLGLPHPIGCLPLPDAHDHILIDTPHEDDDLLLAPFYLENPDGNEESDVPAL